MVVGDRSRSPKDAHPPQGIGSGSSSSAQGGGVGGNLNPMDINKEVEKAFKSQQDAFVKSLTIGLAGPVAATAKEACTGVLETVNGRLSSLELGQKKLEEGQQKVLDELANMQRSINSLSHSKSVPNLEPSPHTSQGSPPPNDVTTPSFWRKPDPTILYCNVHAGVQVSRESFYKSVVKLATEINLDEQDYQLTGDELDDRFELKFLEPSAAAKCLQFHQSLNLGRGKRKTTEVPDPAGGSSHTFYVNPDKNGAQVKKEVMAKHLRDIITPLLPEGKQVFLRRTTGSIMVDRRVLVNVVVRDENTVALAWFHSKRIELKLDEASVHQQFDLVAGNLSSP